LVRRRRGGRRSGEEADPVDTRSNPNADSAAPTFLAKGEGVEDPCSKQVATLVTQRLGAIQNEAADRIFVFPEARLKRWALAAAISFADLVTATTAMLSGMVALQIAEHIANSLEVDETLVRVVIGATSQQKSDEARRLRIEREEAYSGSFRPHLQVQTERRVPSQIFVVALLTVARLRIIRLPDEAITADGEARDRSSRRSFSTIGEKLADMCQLLARSQGTYWCWSPDVPPPILVCPTMCLAIQLGGCRRSSGCMRRRWGQNGVIRGSPGSSRCANPGDPGGCRQLI